MQPLFITHKYPPSIGGMEKQSYELIKRMSEHYDVKTIIYDGSMGRVKFFLSLMDNVRRLLKENPDISFIHLNDGLMGVMGLFIKKITNIPVLVTLHGLDVVFPNKLYQKHIVKKFRRFDGIIPVSRATASECIARGMDINKVFTVFNGVDHNLGKTKKQEQFRRKLEEMLGIPLKDKKILVSIGRAVTRKGFSWFIDNVMTKLDDDIIYLVIGADNSSTKTLQTILKFLPPPIARQICFLFAVETDKLKISEAIIKNKLEQRVFFLGRQNLGTIVQVLYHSDAFVMPNIRVKGDAEGFGLVALEAAVCGLPVIAANLEGITDAIIDGRNGYMLQPGKADVWTDFIHKVLSDRKSLKEFGEKAKEYTIRNYSWEKMVDEYISVFSKVAQNAECREDQEETVITLTA
ncbi:MAG: glycosyltransferase family 4 protein [Spirochaetes bacterium]|nr:glycosyltransferase family 4 protein [Spirochaetota bacterium]